MKDDINKEKFISEQQKLQSSWGCNTNMFNVSERFKRFYEKYTIYVFSMFIQVQENAIY